MSQQIDATHALVSLDTLEEVPGAVAVDDTGIATIRTRAADGAERVMTRQLPLGGWRIVRRR